MSSSSAPSTYTTHAKHSNSSYKKERRKEKRKKKERTHVINPGPITRTVRESNYSNLLKLTRTSEVRVFPLLELKEIFKKL